MTLLVDSTLLVPIFHDRHAYMAFSSRFLRLVRS
jgi:hypothetical protein